VATSTRDVSHARRGKIRVKETREARVERSLSLSLSLFVYIYVYIYIYTYICIYIFIYNIYALLLLFFKYMTAPTRSEVARDGGRRLGEDERASRGKAARGKSAMNPRAVAMIRATGNSTFEREFSHRDT
jgi:hypothetical protein